MNKKIVVSFLLKGSLMLPGTVSKGKRWFCSPWAVISIFGVLLTVFNAVFVLINCSELRPPRFNANETASGPPPPIIPSSKGVRSAQPGQPILNIDDKCDGPGPGPPPPMPGREHGKDTAPGVPSVVVEIVLASGQILGFVINLVVRVGAIVGFSRVRKIIHCLQNHDEQDLPKDLWRKCWCEWSKLEKVYLTLIALSLCRREITTTEKIWGLIMNPCSTKKWLEEMPRLILEQSMVILSLDSVLEIATFLLLSFIGTFVNILDARIEMSKGGQGENSTDAKNENSASETDDGNCDVPQSRFLGNLKLTNSRGIIGNKIGVVEPQYFISERGEDNPRLLNLNLLFPKEGDDPDDNIFQTKTRSRINPGKQNHKDGRICLLLKCYFEMVDVWKAAEGLTGFITLIVFIDHTLNFCLNMFMALASASRFGIFDHRFLSASVSASIIISKMICVAFMAQRLPDTTDKLNQKILELRWKSHEFQDENNSVYKLKMLSVENCLSQVVNYISANPLGLSALGYFSVSKPSLTAMTGVIVTYLVVLVQFHVQDMQTAQA